MLASLVVVGINFLLTLLVGGLVKFERHSTFTERDLVKVSASVE